MSEQQLIISALFSLQEIDAFSAMFEACYELQEEYQMQATWRNDDDSKPLI